MELSRPDITDVDIMAVTEVLASGWIVGGPQQERIEVALAAYCGYEHGVAVSSWTTGAFLVLQELGIGPGDEVLVPSYSFIATANVVRHVGATPVFVDVEWGSWNLDPMDLHSKASTRTKAVIGVDQLGMPLSTATLDAIHALGVPFLRDAACSIGSRLDGVPVGGGANFSVTSFHARKIMTCGEGGMIFTNDAEAAAKLRRLKHQGMSLTDYERRDGLLGDETYREIGYNFRLTDIQAAMLVTQFERLEETIAKRAQIAEWYCRLIDPTQVDLPHVGVGVSPNWQSFQVTIAGMPNSQTRDALIADLRANGIPAKRGVMASHLEPAYIDAFPVHLPVTEAAVVANLTLPMHPRLTLAECELVASKLSASMDRILK